MRDVLNWLSYPQRIVYGVSSLVQRCIEGLGRPYLIEFCCPTEANQRRISLRSSAQAELLVPLRADCYPTAPLFLRVWTDGMEFSPACSALNASGPLCSVFL